MISFNDMIKSSLTKTVKLVKLTKKLVLSELKYIGIYLGPEFIVCLIRFKNCSFENGPKNFFLNVNVLKMKE